MSAKTSTEKVPGGKNVLVEFEDQIAWVTLNRPEKRNAMSPALNDEMVEVLDALEVDDRCGVLVLTGAGESFSAGMDLREYFRALDGLPSTKQLHARRSAWQWQWRQLMNYSQAHHRHGQWLVLRRRVHAARVLRPRDRRRGGAVRPVRDQLGHHPRRQRHARGASRR